MAVIENRSDVAAFSVAFADFTRAQRRARGRFSVERARSELSPSQYLLLEPLLDAGEPLCVGALAESAGVSAPSATRMVDGLAERGYVERLRDDSDRRHVRIALTTQGAETVAAKREQVVLAHTTIFDRLGPGERDAAASLLHSLADAVEELQP